jgi:hypothetical protein
MRQGSPKPRLPGPPFPECGDAIWLYWFMFVVPASAAFLSGRHNRVHAAAGRTISLAWLGVIGVLTIVIGYRYEVGADWSNYLEYLDNVRGATLRDVVAMSDPGYQLLNWLSVQMGWRIYGVNLACGLLFSTGLAIFCRTLPRPWLALSVAVPYLVIVVAMGYSRQSVALGFAMIALAALGRGATARFALWMIVAALFHKSAVVLLPVAALTATRNRYWITAWIAVACWIGYWLLLEQSVDTLYENYVEAQYRSEGAAIRLAMTGLAAGILLLLRSRFTALTSSRLWLWLSMISLALLVLVFATPATAAVDRIALYMLPLQLTVFAHLPDALTRSPRRGQHVVVATLLYYGAVEFVWLNYATHAAWWVPYRFFPFEGGL